MRSVHSQPESKASANPPDPFLTPVCSEPLTPLLLTVTDGPLWVQTAPSTPPRSPEDPGR